MPIDDYITIKVGKLPGAVLEIALNGDRTVQAALAAANLSPQGFEIRVDGESATSRTELEDGSTVLLVKKIQGN